MVPVCSLVIFVSSRARRPVVLELLQPLLDRADGPLVRVRVTVPLDQFPLVAAPHAHPRGVVVRPPAARERRDAQRELAVGRRLDAARGDPCAREDGRKAAPRDRELAVARVSAQRVAAVADGELAVARRWRRWTQGGGGGARGRRRARLGRGDRRTFVRLGGGAVVTANHGGGGAVVIIANNLGGRAVVIANLGGGAVVIITNNLGAGAVVIANLGGGSRGDRLGDACGWRRDERHAIAVDVNGCAQRV